MVSPTPTSVTTQLCPTCRLLFYFCFDGDHFGRYDDDELVDDDKGGDNVKDDDHDDYRIMMTMMKVNIFFWQDLFNHLLAMSSLTKQVLKIFIEN